MREPFALTITDVFRMAGRGPIVTGRLERGFVQAGDEIGIEGPAGRRPGTVVRVETFGRIVTEGRAGQNVALELSGPAAEGVQGEVSLQGSLERL